MPMNDDSRPGWNHYQFNPRKITRAEKEDLEHSLAKFGDLSGIVVNRTTKQIISGNQRSDIINLNDCHITINLELEQPNEQGTVLLGYAKWESNLYSYREVVWTVEQEKEANIVANKLGGNWDFKVLKQHFDANKLVEWQSKRRKKN